MFYSPTAIPLNMLELTNDDIIRLVEELKLTGSYNYIIVDVSFGLDSNHQKIFKMSHAVVWVTNGEEIANSKIVRAYKAAELLDQTKNTDITDNLKLIYNCFSSKTGKYVDGIEMKVVGGTQVFVHASARQVVDQISGLGMFDNII